MVVPKSDKDCIAGSLIGRTDEIGRKSWQITEPLSFSEQQELLCSLCEVGNTATTGHDVSVQCAKLKTSSANAAAASGLRVLQISLECGAAVESLSRPLGRSTTDQKVTAFFNRSKIALGRFAVQAVHFRKDTSVVTSCHPSQLKLGKFANRYLSLLVTSTAWDTLFKCYL